VPGPKDTLYLNGARLDEIYPVSIPTHYLALNITISGYGDNLGFGYIACRRSVPGLQRMLDYTHNAINALENALGLVVPPVTQRRQATPNQPVPNKPASKRRNSKSAT